MDAQDTQDNQDGRLLRNLQSVKYKPLIIIDLIQNSPRQFPYFIPLFEKEATGRSGMSADGQANRGSPPESKVVKWSRKLRVLRIGDRGGIRECQVDSQEHTVRTWSYREWKLSVARDDFREGLSNCGYATARSRLTGPVNNHEVQNRVQLRLWRQSQGHRCQAAAFGKPRLRITSNPPTRETRAPSRPD